MSALGRKRTLPFLASGGTLAARLGGSGVKDWPIVVAAGVYTLAVISIMTASIAGMIDRYDAKGLVAICTAILLVIVLGRTRNWPRES